MSGAAILALAAAFCFALALILTQYGLRTMPSWRAPLYSIGGSVAVAWPLAVVFVDWSSVGVEAALIFATVGCIFPVVVSILAVRSNEALGPAVSGAVGNVTPVFAVLGAVLFLDERLGLSQVAGLAMVVGGVALLALRGGAGGRHWSVWVLGLPLAAAMVRGGVQPAIKTGLALWHEPLAAAAIGYTLSTVVILSLVGRRAWREGPAHPAGVRWFLAVGFANGTATFLLYAALGLGSIALVAPLVALFPLFAVVLSYFFLRGEQLHAVGLLGVVASVAGVILLLVGT
jgi:drug/metabolite transporter (DMT)-like permease